MLIEALIGVLVCILVWWYFSSENPLDKLPGPPRLPIFGNTFQVMRLPNEKLLDVLTGYTKEYGDRYMLHVAGQRNLHIAGPSDIEAMLSHSKNVTKSFPYSFLTGWLGSGLLLSTGIEWHKRRKILTPTFHFNILKNFSVIFEEKTKDLVEMLREKKGAEVEVMSVISDFTLFAICETAMGTKLDADQSAATLNYKTAIVNMGLLLLRRITKIWNWIDFVFYRSAEGKLFLQYLDTARSFADKVIMDRKSRREENKVEEVMADTDIGTKRRLAMLDLLLEAEAKGEIDIKGIRDEVNTFMFEGHDTTALAITYALMLIADHEDVQERIYEEVQNVLGGVDRPVTMSDLADMKYLEVVIKEVLRLYPSVPFIGREVTEDFMMGDVLVKKGTIVDVHIYELHHREDMFPDAEAFKPERFIGTTMKHPYAYLPFSAGPRNCIGQRYAMQEMKTNLSEIIRNFRLVPKVKGVRSRVMADALVLRPIDPIYIKFIPRR